MENLRIRNQKTRVEVDMLKGGDVPPCPPSEILMIKLQCKKLLAPRCMAARNPRKADHRYNTVSAGDLTSGIMIVVLKF